MSKESTARSKLIRELIDTASEELLDEELMHMLISQKVSSNPSADEKPTLGQLAADSVAKFVGSWAFIFSFLFIMAAWMVINILLAVHAFDPYPFILLNLVLSCVAATQAPLIMMSQNRQETKDRSRAESDYRINLKSELIIDDLHLKIDALLENQKRMEAKLEKLRSEKE